MNKKQLKQYLAEYMQNKDNPWKLKQLEAKYNPRLNRIKGQGYSSPSVKWNVKGS